MKLFLVLSLLFLGAKNSWASQTVSIPATVKTSLCGDNTIENPEECEGVNLNGKSCSDFTGFNSGDLKCDSACEFDTLNCKKVEPTPSPGAATATLVSPSPSPAQSSILTQLFTQALPRALNKFAVSTPGRLVLADLGDIIKIWVDGWHKVVGVKVAQASSGEPAIQELEIFSGEQELTEEQLTVCDVNEDEDCNLFDLSVLLYYIER